MLYQFNSIVSFLNSQFIYKTDSTCSEILNISIHITAAILYIFIEHASFKLIGSSVVYCRK